MLPVVLAVMLVVVFGASPASAHKGYKGLLHLGHNNTIAKVTTLVGKVATGSSLVVKNPSGGSALGLQVNADQAPLTVNPEAGTATNLSADELDGKDSSAFASADSTPLWAVVDGSGNIVHSKGVTAASRTHGPGMYKVVFNREVHQCAYSAMPVDPMRWEDAGISVTNNNDMYPDPPEEPNALHVSTWGETYSYSDQQFHLIVYC